MDDSHHRIDFGVMDSGAFLGLSAELSQIDRAQVIVVPIPFEATVSYEGGTADGPDAILKASCQVEFYDREFDCEPANDYGIHTVPALSLDEDPLLEIENRVAELSATGKLIVGLGGEHTLSGGFGRGLVRGLGKKLTVVQIDAHSDLRDQYEDTPLSHACVARRLLESAEIVQILQLGIRSVCTEEVQFARANPDRVRVWYSEEVHANQWREELIRRLSGEYVYLTIDVDGLDPAIIAATGTPEPDGLGWSETLDILRTVAQHSTIVGIDCVELAPREGFHSADFATAKLLYKAINYAMLYSRNKHGQ